MAISNGNRLRSDVRQWLIYERGPVEAVIRALEVVTLGMVGRRWANHPTLQVRAIGNVMLRLADTRLRAGLGMVDGCPTTLDRRTALQWALKIADHVEGNSPEPVEELDEFHAAVFHLDSRLSGAGISGPGWIRETGRGD